MSRMSRRWVAALLALAACASVLAAEDTEEQNAPIIETVLPAAFSDVSEVITVDDCSPSSGPFNATLTFSEDVEGLSADNIAVTPDESFEVEVTFSEPVEGFFEDIYLIEIAPPLLVGVEDGRNSTQTLEIFEDMNVFRTILSDLVQKAFPEEHFFADKLRIRPVYLGRGCLYMMDFPYPLADSRPSRADAEMDGVWEAARQKLGLGADETYDAEKARQFQDAVLSAFKHASNMRHFADADFIAVSAMSGNGVAPTHFSARAEFGNLASPSTSSGRMDVSTAQGGVVVMARALDKTLQEKLGDKYSLGRQGRLYTGNPLAVASAVHLGKGAGGVYLEGYGAVFAADVLFPLAPRSEEDLWEQSARELRAGRVANRLNTSSPSEFKPRGDGKTYTAVVTPVIQSSGFPVIVRGGGFSIYDFSENEAQLKDRLAEGILDALKYASRIQGMDAEEHVAVVVRGMENTQMSFRALKRDVDAYGKGELTREQFQEKLSAQAEAHEAAGLTYSDAAPLPVIVSVSGLNRYERDPDFDIGPLPVTFSSSPKSMTLTFWPPKSGETRNVMKLDGIEVSMKELSAKIKEADSNRVGVSYIGLVLLRSKSDVEVDRGLLEEVKDKSVASDIVVFDDLLFLKEWR